MKTAVIGAGIVGLAVGRELTRLRPDWNVVVVDKEDHVAAHQTGHNSGVIHAGIYYTPGSSKAQMCRRGNAMMKAFCDEHGIRYRNLGKLVVALDQAEEAALDTIHQRALANGVHDVVMLGRAAMREIEPNIAGTKALHSPSTAVVDYVQVAGAMAADIRRAGGTIMLSSAITAMNERGGRVVICGDGFELEADRAIVCGGLQSSRIARMVGDDADPRIVPFRGEYFRIQPQRAALVNGLVYPVPDPRYPFLGIHLTRRVDDTVDIGPNAVLAFALEGYRRRDISMRDLVDTARWPGFRAMARTHWRTGAQEMLGSLSRHRFVRRAAQRYLPELTVADLVPAPAGVRAQAVHRNGDLVDDFCITNRGPITLVRNAPSPAATSSLAIAEHICAAVLAAG